MNFRKKQFNYLFYCILAFYLVFLSGCKTSENIRLHRLHVKSSRVEKRPDELFIISTGYCDCRRCTGWKRNFFGQPVFARGPNKGKRKKVGITSDGTKAIKGTIAADINFWPYGTIFYIPNYGYGVVHDTGTKIQGKYRLDLFFSSHREAMRWGRRTVVVKDWKMGPDPEPRA